MIIHQGIINSYDAMSPQGIIISILGPNIMPISKVLEEVVKQIGAGGDDHINQFHLNHIANHPAHPARDHRPRQPQKDDTGWINEHLSKNFETFKNIPALKGGVLEGLDQIEKVFDPFEIYMLNRLLKKL
jgi:hypothetical protein